MRTLRLSILAMAWVFAGLAASTMLAEDTDGSAYSALVSVESENKTISREYGGRIEFSLHAGKENAGRRYILLGSLSGTKPGFPLQDDLVSLPLNWDEFTDIILYMLNTSAFENFSGTLDQDGQARATLDLATLPPDLEGTKLFFAFACDDPWDLVSAPLEIEITSSPSGT